MKRVETFVTKCIDRGYITEEKAPWLQYALEKRITFLIAMLPLLLIGTVISSLTETIAFYISFGMLRRYTNGIHAKNVFRCIFWSIVCEIAFLGFLTRILTLESRIILLLISLNSIWFLAPYNHPNMALSKEEVAACAVCAKETAIQLLIVIIVLYFFAPGRLADGVLLGFIMAATMLVLTYIPKGGKQNAKQETEN